MSRSGTPYPHGIQISTWRRCTIVIIVYASFSTRKRRKWKHLSWQRYKIIFNVHASINFKKLQGQIVGNSDGNEGFNPWSPLLWLFLFTQPKVRPANYSNTIPLKKVNFESNNLSAKGLIDRILHKWKADGEDVWEKDESSLPLQKGLSSSTSNWTQRQSDRRNVDE